MTVRLKLRAAAALTTKYIQIAYDLGAVSYSVHVSIQEITKEKAALHRKDKAKVKVVEVGDEASVHSESEEKKTLTLDADVIHESAREPKQPELMWFANNTEVKNLIKNRLSDPDRKSFKKTVSIKGSTCSIMSMEAAGRLDVTIKKIGAGSEADIKKNVAKERHQTFEYRLEF